jgi:hypothetical protein
MDIWTAQYRHKGRGRLDVTVKGKDPLGIIFAPSWDMVMGVKNGTMSEAEYSQRYQSLINQILSIKPRHPTIQQILEKYEFEGTLVLVCFCKAYSFCHRYILAETLEKFGWGTYKGELI